MGSSWLLGGGDSVGGWQTRRMAVLGCVLVACGLASLVNACVGSAKEAVKTYHLQEYTNTHWITSIYLFAGLSTLLLHRLRINWFLYLALAFNLLTLPIALGAVIASSVNLHVLRNVPQSKVESSPSWNRLDEPQLLAMLHFAGWDVAYSLVSAAAAVLILRDIRFFTQRYFAKVEGFRSWGLLVSGAAMTVLGTVRVGLWASELLWLKGLGKSAQFLFLHYTMDEPVWSAVYVLTGVLVAVVGLRGSRVLMFLSTGLTAATAYPALLYVWIDYRWYSNVKITEVTVSVPKPGGLLQWNLGLGAAHLLLILATLCLQLRSLHRAGSSYLYAVKLKTDAALRRAVGLAGLLFAVAGVAFLVSDVTNLLARSFYRVFYPTEQRAPFLLLATGLATTLALRDYVALYLLPGAFCLVLMTLHSTVFHVSAYLYLTYHDYFNEELCELFYFGHDQCRARVETIGSVSHFCEAALATALAALALSTAFVLGRLMGLHQVELGSLGAEESRRRSVCERLLTIVGVVRLALGIGTVAVSVSETSLALSGAFRRHPLILLHSYVYRSCLALSLVLYPAAQLAMSRNLAVHPLRAIALIVISLMRFLDILTQMDYRNFSQSHSVGWTVFSIAEMVELFLHFAVVCCAATALDLSLAQPLLPRFDFVEAEEEEEAEVPEAQDAPSDPEPEPWSHAIDGTDGYRLVD